MSNPRHQIGPDLFGESDSLRPFEYIARRVLDLVPGARYARTRDVVEITYEANDETFVILLTPEAIEMRLPTVDWVTPYTPVASTTLWKRVALAKVDPVSLPSLIAGARLAYVRTLRACKYCKQKFAPCHMTRTACHDCATKCEGVVY